MERSSGSRGFDQYAQCAGYYETLRTGEPGTRAFVNEQQGCSDFMSKLDRLPFSAIQA